MKHRIPHADGLLVSQEVIGLIEKDCERIEIAGSLRRQRPDVGDAELVVIPKYGIDLLGEPTNDMLLKGTLANSNLTFVKGQDKYRQYTHLMPDGNEFSIDIWITTPDQWGYIFFLRTGNAVFTHKAVTSKYAGGLLPGNMKFDKGKLYKGGVAIPLYEEEDLFRELGIKWLEPQEREWLEVA